MLLTIPAVFLAVGPLVADLNESHLMNPHWVGHARLHTAWLLATNSFIAILALVPLWRQHSYPMRAAVRLSAMLVGAILLGFFVATATQSLYGGSLTDPNGVGFSFGPVDANLGVFSLLFCLVVAARWLVRGDVAPHARE